MTDAVRRIVLLLQARPGDSLCPACLASSVDLSLEESSDIVDRLVAGSAMYRRTIAGCAGCGRSTRVVRWSQLPGRRPR